MGVSMAPGSMIVTPTPWCFSSMRSASLTDSSAVFEAEIGLSIGTVTRPLAAPIFTRVPPPCRSSGRKACVTAIWPMTLTSN